MCIRDSVYDDGSLEAALLTVERQAVAEISQAAFQQDLQDTFKRVLAGVEAWLGTIERNLSLIHITM